MLQGGFVISARTASVRAVSDPSDELAKRLLSAFELGPSWARSDAPAKKQPEYRDEEPPRDRRDRGGRDPRGERRDFQRGDRGGDRRGGGGGQRGDFRPSRGGDRRQGGGRQDGPREFPQPADGVRVSIAPAAEAVHLVVKEIHHVARVYSLFDVAQILLAGRERYHLQFTVSEKVAPVFRNKLDSSLWLTKEEAVAHFWQSPAAKDLYESEEVETDPPAGNFQVVARCGMSGEWLGPPNFHSYQTTLRRIHREQFSHMPFEVFASRVRTERGEEAVNAWLETMKKRVRWRLKGADDEAWSFDRGEIERDFATKRFAEVHEETRAAEVSGDISARRLSPGLLACVRIATSHARKHPAILIPAICRLLESEHLSVFKREGKLFTGPARPHPLTTDAVLAERPSAMVGWLESHPACKLADLWKGVLPEGETEPGKEWLADLFWLLTQGHVLLFADDTLVLPRRRSPQGDAPAATKAPAAKAAKKKKKKRKRKPRAAKVTLPGHAKTVRLITRMSPGKLRTLRGPELLWRRRLEKRGRIASLVEED
jgi:hypothetical protein